MSALTDIFDAIADAIRAKNGSSDTYTPAQMADAIEAIPSGGETETVLWENPSPQAAYSNYDWVSLSQAISNFKKLRIYYRIWWNYSDVCCVTYDLEHFNMTASDTTGYCFQFGGYGMFNTSKPTNKAYHARYLDFTYNSSGGDMSKCKISQSYFYYESYQGSGSCDVPWKIVGVN